MKITPGSHISEMNRLQKPILLFPSSMGWLPAVKGTPFVPILIAPFEHASMQAPHFVQVIDGFPLAIASLVMEKVGQTDAQRPQSLHLVLSIFRLKRLILLVQLKKAPIGQNRLH